MVPGRVGPPLAVALLSAVEIPPFPPWRLPWAPRVVAGGLVRAAWLRRPSFAPPPGCGLATRALARAGLPGRRTAGSQPGRWHVSGPDLGPGPGWGPGNCGMVFLWAVVPARLVGRGAVGVPARLVPGPADGLPGLMRCVSPEPVDWGSQWGCGRGGAQCRGAGRWWCRSG